MKEKLTSLYGISDNLESGFFINHTITLNNLIEKTNYDYRITCKDEGDVIVVSDEYHFATQEKMLT